MTDFTMRVPPFRKAPNCLTIDKITAGGVELHNVVLVGTDTHIVMSLTAIADNFGRLLGCIEDEDDDQPSGGVGEIR